MCYLEDIYHTKCGHWSDRPRTYHRCPSGPAFSASEPPSPCYNRKSCGSRSEDSHCKRCRFMESGPPKIRGTYFSVSRNLQSGRLQVLIPTGQFAKASDRSSSTAMPSGFTGWRITSPVVEEFKQVEYRTVLSVGRSTDKPVTSSEQNPSTKETPHKQDHG